MSRANSHIHKTACLVNQVWSKCSACKSIIVRVSRVRLQDHVASCSPVPLSLCQASPKDEKEETGGDITFISGVSSEHQSSLSWRLTEESSAISGDTRLHRHQLTVKLSHLKPSDADALAGKKLVDMCAVRWHQTPKTLSISVVVRWTPCYYLALLCFVMVCSFEETEIKCRRNRQRNRLFSCCDQTIFFSHFAVCYVFLLVVTACTQHALKQCCVTCSPVA